MRRAAVLTRHLPRGARVWTARHDDEEWTVGEHLSAEIIDMLARISAQLGGQKKPPPPRDRPSDVKAQREADARTLAKARAFRARHVTT